MKRIMTMIFVSMFVFVGCATNPVVNGKNVGGLIGASGGAYGGSVLTRNSSNGVKIAGIAGGAILGLLVGSKIGAYFDKKDREAQIKLIQSVAESNKDNETSTTQYTKTWSNPNGQQQTGTITQSATPLNTIQPNRNVYANNNVYQGLPNGHPDKWREYTYSQNNQYGNSGVCRDMEISVTIDAQGGPPSQNTFYRMCRTEQGWKLQ